MSKKSLGTASATSSQDAAFGCLLGAFVGDSVGAVLEFNDKNNNPETVDRALTMPGGGVWGVGPGQVRRANRNS